MKVVKPNNQVQLRDVKPGNVVEVKWDDRVTYYLVCKDPGQMTHSGKTLVNIETGRIVYKPNHLFCTKVKASFQIGENNGK